MAPFSSRFVTRVALPAASTLLFQSCRSRCEEAPNVETPTDEERAQDEKSKFANTRGFRPDADGYFHNLFPRRQLWQPSVEYPLWDSNWDGRQPTPLEDPSEDRKRNRKIRNEGVTRHIILIRHGQYDEAHKVMKGILYVVARDAAVNSSSHLCPFTTLLADPRETKTDV